MTKALAVKQHVRNMLSQRVVAIAADNEMLGKIKSLCEFSSFTVYTGLLASCSNISSAIKRQHPNLVIIDLNMETPCGIQLLKHIRRETGVPIITLSSNRSVILLVSALDSGSDGHINKPVSQREFSARLKAYLRRSDYKALR